MAEEALLVKVHGKVGTLVLNRPERRNALSPELLVKIHLQLAGWAGSDDIRCVVISGGEGRAFSSGYDIMSIPTETSPEMEKLMREHNPLELCFDSIRDHPYPVIALLNGYCFGAGLNLAICCDMRLAAEGIKLGMPPAKLGLIYHPEGLRQFVESVGMAATRELFLTARNMTAEEARDLGIINRIIPQDSLVEETYALAEQIADNAPLSLKGMKKILNMIGRTNALAEADFAEAERLMHEGFASDDLKEGQTAFIEKRAPVFKGK